MKILIGAQEYYFISDSIKRIIENNKNHQFMVIADSVSSHTLDWVDFILDPILVKEIYQKNNLSKPSGTINLLKKEISDFKPDIVLSNSRIVSKISQSFNFEHYHFSPKYSYASVWWRKALFETRYKEDFFDISEELCNIKGQNVVSYSPILNIENINFRENKLIKTMFPYYLKPIKNSEFNYKIIFPISDPIRDLNIFKFIKRNDIAFLTYNSDLVNNYNIFSLKDEDTYRKLLYSCEFFVSDGNTSLLTDALMCGKRIVMCPSIKSIEAKVNANILEKEEVAVNLGQIENMEHFAQEYFDKALENKLSYNIGECKNELFNL